MCLDLQKNSFWFQSSVPLSVWFEPLMPNYFFEDQGTLNVIAEAEGMVVAADRVVRATHLWGAFFFPDFQIFLIGRIFQSQKFLPARFELFAPIPYVSIFVIGSRQLSHF